MECRPPQNNETEIMENYIQRDEEEDDLEERFLAYEELEEYKKIQEVFLTFLKAKPINKSDLRKSLFNIAASLMRLLAILEDTPNQESSGCGSKTKANHVYDEHDKSSTKNQSIPKKINRHLEQKNDKKDEQITRVTVQRIGAERPFREETRDMSLHEINDHTMNDKTSGSICSQYIGFPQKNTTQTLLQKNEICNTQLNNETEIVFECKNVEPTKTSFAPQKLHYLSQNQLQDAKINEPTRATIKDELLDMVKKEYFGNSVEKLNSNNDCETNGQNEIIPPLNSIHDNEESEKLETCSKKLEKNSNLKVHKDTAHDHITHTCEKTFPLKNKLDRHINSIHIDTASDVSRKTFTQENYLQNHIDSVQNGQKKHYNCNTCGKAFGLKIALKKHIDLVHNGQKKHYNCNTCGKAFGLKIALKKHIDLVHNGQKSHDRVSCGKTFGEKVARKKNIDSARRSNTHTCDSCGKTFKKKSTLKHHIDFVHKNLKHHKCDRCPKEFSHKKSLYFHVSAVHNGITYTCDLCDKIYIRKSTLRSHIDIVHMNNRKRYECDSCGKTYTRRDYLKVHIDTVHKGITHPCDLCEKVFRFKKSLKSHKDSVHKVR